MPAALRRGFDGVLDQTLPQNSVRLTGLRVGSKPLVTRSEAVAKGTTAENACGAYREVVMGHDLPRGPRPLPQPASPAMSERMSKVRRRDTKPELLVRREAHRRGLRYWVDRRPVAELRTRADLVFPKSRIAVFIDGCFWHGCSAHFVQPKNNAEWWRAKIDANIERDRTATATLTTMGWTVIRAWEHEDPNGVVDRIQGALSLST